jgi:hypothetical protein
MKIYVVVRDTTDAEFNTIEVFYSVHAKKEEAEAAIVQYNLKFGFFKSEFEILEREVK